MIASERNRLAGEYVEEQIVLAREAQEEFFIKLRDYGTISAALHDLIRTDRMGFRGVVLTAIVGLKLDTGFDPLSNFYGCHPRAIFENGIYGALVKNDIPCGKSDPLNVAKNVNVLNLEWAAGKRPESAARAAIFFIQHLVDAGKTRRQKLIQFYFYRLLRYADEIRNIRVALPDAAMLSNQVMAHKLVEFTIRYPEGGAVPQVVVGTLLRVLYEDSQVRVRGADDSVFGTNTTSKKPADIWLEKDGGLLVLLEVTVKKVDEKRLMDCLEALIALNCADKPVTFLCRMPENLKELEHLGFNGCSLAFKGKQFDFIDLRGFVLSLAGLLSHEQMVGLISELHLFVKDIKRQVSTKQGWNSVFADMK